MTKKNRFIHLLSVTIILFSVFFQAIAFAGNYGGAFAEGILSGMDTYQQMLQEQIRIDQQKQLMQYQYELDMQRLRQQEQLRRESFERESRERAALEAAQKKRVEEESLEAAKRTLTKSHPDWVEVVNSRDFSEWAKTLPETERKRLMESEDPYYVADKITIFKMLKANAKFSKE